MDVGGLNLTKLISFFFKARETQVALRKDHAGFQPEVDVIVDPHITYEPDIETCLSFYQNIRISNIRTLLVLPEFEVKAIEPKKISP